MKFRELLRHKSVFGMFGSLENAFSIGRCEKMREDGLRCTKSAGDRCHFGFSNTGGLKIVEGPKKLDPENVKGSIAATIGDFDGKIVDLYLVTVAVDLISSFPKKEARKMTIMINEFLAISQLHSL